MVNGAKSYFTVAFPEIWLLILGGLFIVVTLFLPDGIIGALKKMKLGKKTPEVPVAEQTIKPSEGQEEGSK